MRALATGAAGFVGSHLVDRLLAEGYEVIGVDNLITGRAVNLEHLSGNSKFEFRVHDVIQPLDIEGPLDWIFHFASPASPPRYQAEPIMTLRVNAEGTFHLLELARKHKAGFMLASTSEVYGDPLVHPQHEEYWGNVNPVGPRSMYDEGKRYAEALTVAYNQIHGVDTRIVRIFNTYGPRMAIDDGRVVTNLVGQALRGEPMTIYGDGLQTRSFQYIDDLTAGIWSLMGNSMHLPVNIGNPDEFTIMELARMIKLITGTQSDIVHLPAVDEDPSRRRPNIRKAQTKLGWHPIVSLEDGISRTISWFRERHGGLRI